MKAAVLHQICDDKLDLRTDMRTNDPGPGEVRIRVRATGICHSDLSAMNQRRMPSRTRTGQQARQGTPPDGQSFPLCLDPGNPVRLVVLCQW